MSNLDSRYAEMQAGGDGLAFYHALADTELFVLLETEAEGEVMSPQIFDLAESAVVLAFDSAERLARFVAGPQPYAALPGRVIVGQMAGQGLALGLNIGVGAASEVILPPEALDWLMEMLDQTPPQATSDVITGFEPPDVPQAVLLALPLALIGATRAYLVGVCYKNGRRDQLLAVMGVAERDETRVARAVTEALAFSGLDAAALDLAFMTAEDAVLARMAGVALVFEPSRRISPAGPKKTKAPPPKLR